MMVVSIVSHFINISVSFGMLIVKQEVKFYDYLLGQELSQQFQSPMLARPFQLLDIISMTLPTSTLPRESLIAYQYGRGKKANT